MTKKRKSNDEPNLNVCKPQLTTLEKELQEQIAHKDRQIAQKDEEIALKNEEIVQKNEELAQKDEQIVQKDEEIVVLTKENAKHCQDKEDLHCKVKSLTAECDYHRKNTQRNHYEQGAIHNDHSVHKTLTIHGDTWSEHHQKIMSEFLGDHPPQEEVKSQPEQEVTKSEKQAAPTAHSPVDAFVERTKAIVRQMATKNGCCVKTCAKGHANEYVFKVDAECFCRAMDKLALKEKERLRLFLEGSKDGLEVTRVCFFIGNVIRKNIINNAYLQIKDLLFAFKDYYENLDTVKNKLSVKEISPSQKVVFSLFEGYLREYSS